MFMLPKSYLLFQLPSVMLILFQMVDFVPLTPCIIAVVVGPLWQTFVSSLRVYELSSVEGADDPYEGRYDSDGAEKSLESFVIQVSMSTMFADPSPCVCCSSKHSFITPPIITLKHFLKMPSGKTKAQPTLRNLNL